jgi:hypothetical protein
MRFQTIVVLGVLSFGSVAYAQQPTTPPVPLPVRQYAAKFVCGRPTTQQTGNFDIAPGLYYTIINVHNPALAGGVEFRKKFALAERDEKPGKISEWIPVFLKADQAMQINCGNIYKHLGIVPGTFIDGFAVIQMFNTKPELDVVGVYTASPGNGVSSIDIERVEGRITQ